MSKKSIVLDTMLAMYECEPEMVSMIYDSMNSNPTSIELMETMESLGCQLKPNVDVEALLAQEIVKLEEWEGENETTVNFNENQDESNNNNTDNGNSNTNSNNEGLESDSSVNRVFAERQIPGEMLEKLAMLWCDDPRADVSVIAGDDMTVYKCHSVILAARCGFVANQLGISFDNSSTLVDDSEESNSGCSFDKDKMVLSLGKPKPVLVQHCLEFIYTGRTSIPIEPEDSPELYELAGALQIPALVALCEQIGSQAEQIPENQLGDDLAKLLDTDNSLSDVTLVLEQDKRIKAHKLILSLASEFFESMFSSEFLEASMEEIPIHETSFDAFMIVLRYIYGNEMVEIPPDLAMEVFLASNQFLVSGLQIRVENMLIEAFDIHNCSLILQHCFDTSPRLKSECLEYMFRRFDAVTCTENFLDLDQKFKDELLSMHGEFKEDSFNSIVSTVSDGDRSIIASSIQAEVEKFLAVQLQNINIPDQFGESNKMSYEISNMNLTDAEYKDVDVKMMFDRIVIDVTELQMHMKETEWRFAQNKFPFIKDHGTANFDLTEMTISIIFDIQASMSGHPSIMLNTVQVSIGSFKMKTTGSMSLIYNSLFAIFNTKIKTVVETEMQERFSSSVAMLTDTINMLGVQLLGGGGF